MDIVAMWKWPFLLCLPLAIGSLEVDRQDDVVAGVAVHWSFEDIVDERVLDTGPYSYDGTIVSRNEMLPESVEGIRGKALRFPAKHQSWVELDSRFNLQPPFTFTIWLRLSARGTMEVLGQKAHSGREGMRIAFSTQRFDVEYSDGQENIMVQFFQPQIKPGQWVFIAVVHDGEEITLYVDAEEVLRETARPTILSRRPMLIGNYTVRKDVYPFVGTMDEMIILDKALSQKELFDLGRRTTR